MRKLLAHHLHKDRVHHTALFVVLVVLALLGLDLGMVETANAPTIPGSFILQPLFPGSQPAATSSLEAITYPYIEVTDSCGPYYDGGPCVNLRSGPGESYPVVMKLRTGVVLKVAGTVVDENGRGWYKLIPDTETLRYPERVSSDWYVASDVVTLLYDTGDHMLTPDTATTTKRIVVNISQQMLYAYDGDTLFMAQSISTGLTDTPTPLGIYHVYKKTPSRYMQGPIEGLSDQYYDLPGVPWNLYFTQDGAVIHGAYWHNHFGEQWSHGCVNMPLSQAKKLYYWADIGTLVTVQE